MNTSSLLLLGAGLWLAGQSVPALSSDLDNASALKENNTSLCKQEYTKRGELDASGFDYCMHWQAKAVAELKAQQAQYGSLPWFADALRRWTTDHTKRGLTNYRQLNYQMKLAVDGYLDVQYKLKSSEISAAAFDECKRKWTKDYVDWRMINVCVSDG